MRVDLPVQLADSAEALEAQRIIGSCVHCGFCTAVCPTYRLTGEELEGPRGRIYLIKNALAGERVTEVTARHLDSCLTCRACETACPSGVEYGQLIEIGRKVVDERLPMARWRRTLRRVALRMLMNHRRVSALLRTGRALRFLLPAGWAQHVPKHSPDIVQGKTSGPTTRRVLLLQGCVQPALMPNVNAATERVLARFGIEAISAARAGCCGALPWHAGEESLAIQAARRNVDAWWPWIEQGVEALVMTASGCGAAVRDYGRLLRHEPGYAERAVRVAALVRDVVEVIADELHGQSLETRVDSGSLRVSFHPPCTLQHGQQLAGRVEDLLVKLGAEVLPLADAGQCCGSAGTYSLRHPHTANALRDRKLALLEREGPEEILSANVGCIAHLATASRVPVRHWIEWLDRRLAGV